MSKKHYTAKFVTEINIDGITSGNATLKQTSAKCITMTRNTERTYTHAWIVQDASGYIAAFGMSGRGDLAISAASSWVSGKYASAGSKAYVVEVEDTTAAPTAKQLLKKQGELKKRIKAAKKTIDKALKPAAKQSNKHIVFAAWKKRDGEISSGALHKLVKGAVKLTTIKSWMSAWRHGRNLPATAK